MLEHYNQFGSMGLFWELLGLLHRYTESKRQGEQQQDLTFD